MKVLNIKRGQKGGYFTKCEGLDKDIYTKEQPNWNVGDELGEGRFELSPSGKSYMLKKGEFTTPSTSKPPYQRPAYQPKDDLWIVQQTCFKAAVDLTLPSIGVKPITPTAAIVEGILKLTEELLHGMILIRSRVNVERKNE